ncbi:MAG: InlB B-repeat-containing protein [Phocaeicola sp.]
MIKLIKSTFFVLSGALAMSSCFTDSLLEEGPEKISIRFVSGDNGDISLSGSNTADRGSVLYSVATAMEGYEFAGWHDGTKMIEGGGAFTIVGDTLKVKLTQMTANTTYTAKFRKPLFRGDNSLKQCTVNFTSATVGGRANPTVGSCCTGKYISSTALPDSDYIFDGWFDSEGNEIINTVETDDIYVCGRTLNVKSSPSTHNQSFAARYVKVVLEDGRATPRIYAVGEGDDAMLVLTRKDSHRGILFQFGSVIAWNRHTGTESDNVSFNPSDLSNKWRKKWKVGVNFPKNTSENIKAGKGDPCRLLGLTVAQIKALTAAGREVDNYTWRMPLNGECWDTCWDRSEYKRKGINGYYFGPGATKKGTGGEFFPNN